MFAQRYFAARYFAAEFFAEVGATSTWPAILRDLTTQLCKYIPTLQTLNADITTALMKQIPTWRAADPATTLDTNTVIARALS